MLFSVFGDSVRNVIDNIKRANQETNYMQLVNEKGYWLAGPDSKDEWAFMYAGKSENTFADKFPDEWARITTEKNGSPDRYVDRVRQNP